MATEGRIDLKKKVGIVLEKRKLFNLMVKVGAAFDVSGSTQKLFANGTMQNSLTRVFAIADKVDDNHTLDAWIYSNDVAEMPGIDPNNYESYVADIIVNSNDRNVRSVLWGGTRFHPFMDKIVKFYNPEPEEVVVPEAPSTGFFGKVKALFGAKAEVVAAPIVAPVEAKPELPAFVMPFTDGENGDETATEQLIKSTKDTGVFWQFVGVGAEKFGFLKRMAVNYPHVGFVDIKDLNALSADQLYEALITEKFANWVKTNYPHAIEQAGQQREQGK